MDIFILQFLTRTLSRFTKPPPPGFKKKPTGLEKKPFGPKYPAKKINPKYQKYNKLVKPPQKKQVPVKKVRLAPIPDLRPTSIDRIDILRPQPQQNKQFPVRTQTPVNKPRGPPPPSSRVTPASRPAQTGIKIVPSKSSINRVDTNSLIEFNESPVEVNGLKLFMFRGDEGIGGSQFQPFSASVSGHYTPQQLLFSQPSTPQLQYNNSPFQWSKAEIRPSSGSSSLSVVNTTPRYAINDVAPPFPTRHTTPSPHGDQPIVIIAQSNVAQN